MLTVCDRSHNGDCFRSVTVLKFTYCTHLDIFRDYLHVVTQVIDNKLSRLLLKYLLQSKQHRQHRKS